RCRESLARARGRAARDGICWIDCVPHIVQPGHGCGYDADHGNTPSAYELRWHCSDGDVHRCRSGVKRANAKVCKLGYTVDCPVCGGCIATDVADDACTGVCFKPTSAD